MSASGTADLANLSDAPAIVKPTPPPPQYATGFDGAATEVFPETATAILLAPVDPQAVEIKPNGIVYLPGVWYRRLLTSAFGPGAWALLPRGPSRLMGDIVVYHGALFILGRFVSEAVGECECRAGMSYASALEGARTDALTRCCKDLGVGTELWDPTWRERWQATYAVKGWNQKTNKPDWKKKGEATVPALPAAPKQLAISGAEYQAPTATETGEAPNDGLIEKVRDAVAGLKWTKVRAMAWAKMNFGVTNADQLTKDQAAAALELLAAAAIDDGDVAYEAVYEKLLAAGRVLRGAI